MSNEFCFESLAQFVAQHARDIAEVATAEKLPMNSKYLYASALTLSIIDPVKQHAVIYLKGHITRSLKDR